MAWITIQDRDSHRIEWNTALADKKGIDRAAVAAAMVADGDERPTIEWG